jgi:hypothetical protein
MKKGESYLSTVHGDSCAEARWFGYIKGMNQISCNEPASGDQRGLSELQLLNYSEKIKKLSVFFG